jgi:uncharacterized repeat protein (TIGR01451 family)
LKQSVIFLALWTCLSALGAAPAWGLSSGQVSIRLASGPKFVSDSNNCSGGDGPHAAYVAYAITNTSGSTRTGVVATLNGFGAQPGSIPNPPASFTLAGGQAQTQLLGTLANGETRHVYWYVAYPCHGASPSSVSASVTIGDSSAGTVTSSSSTLTSTSSISANAGGLLSGLTLGNNAFVGQIVTMDVNYLFGNVQNGDDFLYQPVGNTSFPAGCFLLTRSQVLSADFSSVIPAGVGSDLYFVATGSRSGSGQKMTVRYSFIYDCDQTTATAVPYAAQKSGAAGLKYSGNFGAPEATVGLPEATNAFTIEKSATPTTLPSGSTGPVTYTVTVTNTGTIDATLGSIDDVLPAGFAFQALAAGSDVTGSNSALVPAAGATGAISFVSNPIPAASRYLVAAGTSFKLVYTATIAGGTQDGFYTNSASAQVGQATSGPAGAAVRIGSPPVIGIAKEASLATDNGDGTFTTTIALHVTNLGAGPLSNVQVRDDLRDAFPAPATFSVANVSIGSLTASAAPYDGAGQIDLLAGTDSLASGVTRTLSFQVTFDPQGSVGPFSNQAVATASGTSDLSESGTDPDLDDDGNPGELGENDPTPISFPAQQVVGLAKEATAGVANGDGTFTSTIRLRIQNLGNVALRNLQLSDDLRAAFPAPASFVVSNLHLGGLSAPALAYDGSTRTNLLAGTDTLPFGGSALVEFDVTYDPNGAAGPFLNQATAIATGTSDLSQEGVDPDPDHDGDPDEVGENTATSITFTNPVIGIAKQASAPVDNGDGSFTTTITLSVENLGNVPLTQLQVSDDLVGAFPAPSVFSVSNVALGALGAATPAYDGSAQVDLLAGNGVLAIGATALLSFDVRFTPNGAPGPFFNLATASVTGSTDVSDNGSDPDPDGDGNPAEIGEDDATPIRYTGVVGLAKQAGAITDHGDGTFTTTITLTIENLSAMALQNLQVRDDLSAAFPVARHVQRDERRRGYADTRHAGL